MNSGDVFINSLSNPEAFEIGNYYFYNFKTDNDKYLAFKHYQVSAYKNYTPSQNCLGICYMEGFGVSKDEKKGFEWFLKASKKKNINSYNNLYRCYLLGVGTKKDLDKAFFYIKESADNNNEYGCFELSKTYLYGTFGITDIEKGLKFLNIASDLNFDDATMFLGELYEQGNIVRKNIKKALEYYEKASDNGYIFADNSIALMYLDNKKYDLTIKYLDSAISKGDIAAYHNYGYIYENGFGVKKSIKKAIEYYNEATIRKFPKSIYRLAYIYANGLENIKKDLNKAIELLNIADELNYPEATFMLAGFYKDGIGIKKDLNKALKYYEKASNLKYINAMLYLGDKYYNDKEFNKAFELYEEVSILYNNDYSNYMIAFMWYNKFIDIDDKVAINYLDNAINLKFIDAFYLKGYLYEKGIYFEKDLNKAKEYYTECANMGNNSALNKLKELSADSKTIKKIESKIKKDPNNKYYEYLNKANNNDYEAMFLLGELYEYGNYVDKDINEAIKWYEKASLGNYVYAIDNLGYLYDTENEIKDEKLAIKYYKKAIKLGSIVSIHNLAVINLKSNKVEEAIELLLKSASKDFTPSYKKLGDIYEDGIGVEKDINKAIEYFTKGALLDDVLCQDELAYIYYSFKGYINYKLATKWFKKAIEKNSIRSMHNLGLLMYKQRRFYESFPLFENAANGGLSNSMYQLMIMYYNGIGVKKDYNKALYWYNLAKLNGYEVEKNYLNNINKKLNRKNIFSILKKN